jgi:translation initiation factor 4G
MTGNIVFIGQLFKTQMISEQIIHSCLDKLIDEPNESNIECICKLLEITGGKMRGNIDENFRKLKAISENKVIIDSRHRFMIKDLIELKQNNWVSRKTNQPLKMA